MAPTRPNLRPLSTPKNMAFPSELRERTYTCLDSAKSIDGVKTEEGEMAITPPPAYTEFLRTFSPIFSSPKTSRANFSKYMHDRPRPSPASAPPNATTFSSRGHSSSRMSSSLLSPHYTAARCLKSPKSPDHIRRLRLPPPHVYSPMTASPYSAYPRHSSRYSYSPTEWRFQQMESPFSDDGSFSVRRVVTTTITLTRAPQLEAPPAWKRKRSSACRKT